MGCERVFLPEVLVVLVERSVHELEILLKLGCARGMQFVLFLLIISHHPIESSTLIELDKSGETRKIGFENADV